MNWQELIEFLGGVTAISLTIGYLGKRAIDGYVSGRLEAYKSDLSRITAEHSVRFQKLHAERAEIIRDFYAKFAKLDDLLTSILRSFQAVEEESLTAKVQRLGNEFNELREYFLARRIFFTPEICASVDSVLESAKGIFYDITTLPIDPTHAEYKSDRGALLERRELWEQARAAHRDEFAKIKAELEKQFRALLGIGV